MPTIDSQKILNEVIKSAERWKETGVLNLEDMPVWRIYRYRRPGSRKQLYELVKSAVEEAAMRRDLGPYVEELIFECPEAEQCFHCGSFMTELASNSQCPIRQRHGTGDPITVEVLRP